MEEGTQTVVKKIIAKGFQCLNCRSFWRDDSFVSGIMENKEKRTECPLCGISREEGNEVVLDLGEEEVSVDPPHRPEKCEGC